MVMLRADLRKFLRLALSILAGLLVIASLQRAARAGEAHLGEARMGNIHVIVVPANDGYGIQDCLLQQKGCGDIVATAWCEAKGYSRALAYGRADDVTGSIAHPQATKLDGDSLIVECRD